MHQPQDIATVPTKPLKLLALYGSAAALKKVDEIIIFNAMARIRDINAQAMARIGLMVDDYSAGRIKSLEDGMLIGFHVAETPRRAQHLSEADDMGIELPTSQNPEAWSASAVTTPTDAPRDGSETDDDPWSFDEE